MPYVLVVHCLQLLVVRPCLLVVIFVVASCWLSGGDVESSVSVTSTRAHTLIKQKKKKFHLLKSCCRNEEGHYIWYQSRFDPRLGIRYGFH
jgi:hypothetical protein